MHVNLENIGKRGWMATAALLTGLLLTGAAQALPPAVDDPDMVAALRLYESGAFRQAAVRYEKAARRGQPIAQFNLASMLRNGEGVTRNPARAKSWLDRAARGGLSQAQYAEGLLYENGDGVKRSATEAMRWFRRAAEQGHTDAQISLATQYFTGRGVPQDYAQAARWYESAAEGGAEEAQYIIASCYEHGDGVPADLDRALYWYTQAALQGDAAAGEKAKVIGRMIGTTRPM